MGSVQAVLGASGKRMAFFDFAGARTPTNYIYCPVIIKFFIWGQHCAVQAEPLPLRGYTR